jgi:Tol biopolymer transport system component
MKKIDWAASTVITGAILLLIGVVFIGNRIPITVSCQSPNPCTQVGPFGSVTFEFSRPVKSDLVESLWQTAPQLSSKGKWEWLDNQHVRWYSVEPLPSDQKVTLQFTPGRVGENGEQIDHAVQWDVVVRSPRIIVVRHDGTGQELFTYGMEAGSSEYQLTQTQGRVYDYQHSPDGESVVFSAINDQKGIDLWIVQRDGSNQHKLLDCGADRCTTPAWSPISQELAYTREGAGLDPNGPKGVPRIWILNIQSGQTSPLFTDLQKIGYGPKWSPDGQWLSIWNGSQGGIEVVNRETGNTFLLESASGDAGTWTQNSQFLYYDNTVVGETSFHNVVLRADISNQTVSTILGGNVEGGGLSVSNPVTSPTDKWVAVTIQENVQIPGRELFLLFPDSKDGISISDDLSRIPGFYSWTPDGNRLVYQLDVLGGKENDVEIWVWERKKGKSIRITTGGRSPQWLP